MRIMLVAYDAREQISMSSEIVMPKLSDTMEEGKIIRWLKHPGDRVNRGDALAEVETDKADMVMESFEEGILAEIRLKEGESAHVGATIAVLRGAGEAASTQTAPVAAEEAPPAKAETPVSAARSVERVTPIRVNKRGRNGNGAKPVEEAKVGAAIPTTAAPASEAPAAEEEMGGFPVSRDFHPALTAHPSAAPTAIVAPPLRPTNVVTVAETPETHDGSKVRSSPLARRAAEEAGIDLSQVRGTGPDGRVTKRDLDHFIREQQLFQFRRLVAPREGLPGTREELSKMRKTIAQRMAQSKREIPHFYVTVEVDMEEVVKLKKSFEVTELFEENVTYNDIIIKATALALMRYPRMNASYQDDGIVIYPNINIGVAVAVEDGLIVPVIHECERKSLPEISRASHQLVAKAARGGFTGDDLSGATFTISNMGMLGVEHFAAVIVPPQAGILAVSAVKEKPVVRNSQVVVGRTMMITVACDHRIIDGVVGARFVNEIKRFLENPASLLV